MLENLLLQGLAKSMESKLLIRKRKTRLKGELKDGTWNGPFGAPKVIQGFDFKRRVQESFVKQKLETKVPKLCTEGSWNSKNITST